MLSAHANTAVGNDASTARAHVWLILILLFAIILRVGVHLQASANDPSYGHIRQDEKTYSGWAESFSRWEMPEGLPFAAPPFYSFVLGNTIYRIFGPDVIAVYIFNNLLALLNMYLLFLLGRKAWDARAGLIAAFVYNLYSPFLMLELKLMVTTFSITFALLALYWAMLAKEKDARLPYWVAGLMVGLATIARPTFVFFLPFYLLWLFRTVKPLKAWAISTALIIVGFVIPIIPVCAANFIGGNDFIPLTTTGGLNFYIGNSDESNGLFIKPTGFRDLSLRHELEDAERIAEAETGRQMKPSEVSSHYMRKGMVYIRTHPIEWMRLLYWKLRLLVSKFEMGDVWDYYTSLEKVALYRWVNMTFVAVITLAAIGLAWTWGANRWISLLSYYLLSFVVYQLLFFVCTRFRLPFVAVLCIFIGAGVSALVGKRLTFRRGVVGIIIGVVVFTLSISPLTWIEGGGTVHGEHYNLGLIYLDKNEPEKAKEEFLAELEDNPDDGRVYAKLAIAELRLGNRGTSKEYLQKALRLQPDNVVVLGTSGQYLLEKGEWEDAEAALRKALWVEPNDTAASFYLADLLFRTGRSKEALELAESIALDEEKDAVVILQLLGMIQLDIGSLEDASGTFRKALEYNLEDVKSWFYLGMTLSRMGRFDEASGAFAEAEKLDPEYPGLKLAIGDAWYGRGEFEKAKDAYSAGIQIEPESYELYHNLGLAYWRLGRPDDARDAFAKAIELKEDYYQAYYNLGNLYISQGDAENAIANLEAAIELKDDFAPALLNLGTIYAQLGDYDKAREYWERVVEAAPGSNEAAIAQRNLEALDDG